jgi:hypothetical protein
LKNSVLFLVFNRADTTAQVFEAIRQARPPRLYVAADGAREGRPGEDALCEETRRVATQVDWPCEVRTLFRDRNLGCKAAVSSAITWFFEHEEQGVILEDDCLPAPVFFAYCDELLEKYRDDERVTCISGDNFLPDSVRQQLTDSYYFSVFNHIWGWASWRRAWQGYDVNMSDWSLQRGKAILKRVFPDNPPLRRIWLGTLDRVARGEINTWDYQWVYHCWRAGGLTCLPSVNLISNIGFDERATHTVDGNNQLAALPTQSLAMPLKHPVEVRQNHRADKWSGHHLFPVARYTLRRVLGRRIKVFLGLRQEA